MTLRNIFVFDFWLLKCCSDFENRHTLIQLYTPLHIHTHTHTHHTTPHPQIYKIDPSMPGLSYLRLKGLSKKETEGHNFGMSLSRKKNSLTHTHTHTHKHTHTGTHTHTYTLKHTHTHPHTHTHTHI